MKSSFVKTNRLEETLSQTAKWVRVETLHIHQRAPETRVASSLSAVEILTALYYGGILQWDAQNPHASSRDRLVISKGHGAISMYPILADLGFFEAQELLRVGREGSFLGGIPDPVVPGIETINGSLGHGLGVACGMALSLKLKRSSSQVFVLAGDGEMNEGAMWEAIQFAAHHRLDNLNLIIDKNQKCMLDHTQKVIGLDPLGEKPAAFGFEVWSCDGHDVMAVRETCAEMKARRAGRPKCLIAETIKGKGVPKLESQSLCHVMALSAQEVDEAIAGLGA